MADISGAVYHLPDNSLIVTWNGKNVKITKGGEVTEDPIESEIKEEEKITAFTRTEKS